MTKPESIPYAPAMSQYLHISGIYITHTSRYHAIVAQWLYYIHLIIGSLWDVIYKPFSNTIQKILTKIFD